MVLLDAGSNPAEHLPPAFQLLAAALASLGNLAFGVFAWRAGNRAARAFARLCISLAAWSAALFLRDLFGDPIPAVLPWIVAVTIPPAALSFVAHQGHWRPRWVEAVRRLSFLAAAVQAFTLAALGSDAVPATAASIYVVLVFALFVLYAQNRRRPREGRLVVVVAGLVCLCSSIVDALPWFGFTPSDRVPALRPLASLVLVALLGSGVARHQLYQLRPLLGRVTALAGVTIAVAAVLVAPLGRWPPDSVRALLWCWLVLMVFVLLERRLFEFLRSPSARDRERRRRSVIDHLQAIDGVLSTGVDLLGVRSAVLRHLEGHEEVEAVSLELEAPEESPGSPSPATSGDPASSEEASPGRHWVRELIAQGRRQGRLEMSWRDRELVAEASLEQTVDAFAARLATAFSALRLQEEKRRTEQLARLGVMASGIAHEIKNPLGAILGALDLMEGKVRDDGRRWLDIVRQESRRLDRFVGEVLLYGRAPRPQLAEVSVRDLLQEVATSIEEAAREHDIRVVVEGDGGRILADGDQLRRALLNLALNAVEAQAEQADRDRPGAVRLRAELTGSELGLRVEDDGPGLDEGDRERVFDPFFTTRSRGTGLGLAIAHQIVEAHGGSLRLEDGASDPEALRGAVFRILLPRHAKGESRGG